jgi:hypothetical protein
LTSLWIDSLQAFQAAASLLYLFRPLADRAVADAQAARDPGSGEVAFAEEAIAFRPPFFNLLRSQLAGLPYGQSL